MGCLHKQVQKGGPFGSEGERRVQVLVRMDEGIKIMDDSGWMPELECGTLFLCV